MSFIDLTPEERAALIERQRKGWHAEGTALARIRDARRAKEWRRALKAQSERLERKINALKDAM